MGREDEAFRLLKEQHKHYIDSIGKEVEILNGIADLLQTGSKWRLIQESDESGFSLERAKIRAGISLCSK